MVDGYDQLELPRRRPDAIKIGVLEFEGLLRVTSVEAFLAALARGFGHAKAFGCGLMLIRRA
jgi:CRISPR system Cascade subunit CasE